MNPYQYPPCLGQEAPTQYPGYTAPNPGSGSAVPPGGYPPAASPSGWQGTAPVPAWNGTPPAPPAFGYVPIPPTSPAGYPAPGNTAFPAPPVYPQPVVQPVQPQAAYYAPPFVVNRGRDPRLSGAGKTMNRMCLVVLLQTAAAFVLEIPLILLMTLLNVNIYTDSMALQWFTAAMVPLSTALPFFVYLKIGNKDVTDYLRFEKVGFPTALLCVLAGLAICLLGNFPSFAIQDFFENFGYEPSSALSGGTDSWPMFALEFFATAVLVPAMEEFAFRGVLFSSLRKYGVGLAIIGSALVFSLVHLDFSNVLFAFIAGLVFGFLYEKTRCLWITIFIHALNNGIAVIGTYEDFLFGSLAGTMDVVLMIAPIVIGLVALVLLLVLKRDVLFRRDAWNAGRLVAVRPLTAGETAVTITRAPLLWVIVAFMAAYTTSLFF